MCAVRISLLPVSSCSCSQEEIRSLGIAEPVSLKIILATALTLCYTTHRAITEYLFHCSPFIWVVGTLQCKGYERVAVVAFSFPATFGRYLPTLRG